MRRRWRVEYEAAVVNWIVRQRPSLHQICAAVLWAAPCRALGPPEESVQSPDPDAAEDHLVSIPGIDADVLFIAYGALTEDPVMS